MSDDDSIPDTQAFVAGLNAAALQVARAFQPWVDSMTRLADAFRAYGLLDPLPVPRIPNGTEYARRQRARQKRR